jgi:hypothetical protein
VSRWKAETFANPKALARDLASTLMKIEPVREDRESRPRRSALPAVPASIGGHVVGVTARFVGKSACVVPTTLELDRSVGAGHWDLLEPVVPVFRCRLAPEAKSALQLSNENSISQLRGPFGYLGASVDLGLHAGADVFSNASVTGIDVGAGVGLDVPIPVEVHGGLSWTCTLEFWNWGC